jgi:ribonuclease E
VLRRLLECLARDRTKHQVAEVTSLGLVQMTRKRVGSGLLEAFSEPCECCNGRGVIVSLDLTDRPAGGRGRGDGRAAKGGRQSRNGKNGKDSGRRVPEPAIAEPDGGSGSDNGGAALDEAGLDGTGTDGPAAESAEAEGAAGADVDRPDGDRAPHPSGGRRRRRAATRQQGPPEPVSQLPDTEPPAPPEPGGQESIAAVPGLLLPATEEPVAPVPGVQAPGTDAAGIQAPDGGGLDGKVTGTPVADPLAGDGQPAEPATD